MSTIERALNKQKAAQKNTDIKDEQSTTQKSEVETASLDNTQLRSNDIDEAVNASESIPTSSNTDTSIEGRVNKKLLEIDILNLEQNGFVSKTAGRNIVNEEFRSIKRKLLSNTFGALKGTLEHGNLIMVSSSRPNEGKTFTAVNLALSIAVEKDVQVLLVDSDVIRPSVDKVLNFKADVGLVEYLLGEEENVENIIYQTNIDGLRIVPAGTPHHLTSELLASERMKSLAGEFANRYPDRIVIMDAPPLLGINESVLVASLVGQILVVVEEGKTKVSDLSQVTELLPTDKAIGFVVNKAIKSEQEQYGYGYY